MLVSLVHVCRRHGIDVGSTRLVLLVVATVAVCSIVIGRVVGNAATDGTVAGVAQSQLPDTVIGSLRSREPSATDQNGRMALNLLSRRAQAPPRHERNLLANDPTSPPPLVVGVAADMTRVRTIDERKQSFSVQMFLLFDYDSSKCVRHLCKPLGSGIPFMFFDNAVSIDVLVATGPLEQDPVLCPESTCYVFYLTAQLHKEYDMDQFWYDTQRLTVQLESWWTTDELTIVPLSLSPVLLDQERTFGSDPDARLKGVPSGWDFVNMTSEAYLRKYPTVPAFGVYHALNLHVEVQRQTFTWELKLRLPMLIISLFVFSLFILGAKKEMLETRITSCFESLLVFIAFGLYLSDNVPPGGNTIADKLWALGLVWSLVLLVLTLIMRILAMFVDEKRARSKYGRRRDASVGKQHSEQRFHHYNNSSNNGASNEGAHSNSLAIRMRRWFGLDFDGSSGGRRGRGSPAVVEMMPIAGHGATSAALSGNDAYTVNVSANDGSPAMMTPTGPVPNSMRHLLHGDAVASGNGPDHKDHLRTAKFGPSTISDRGIREADSNKNKVHMPEFLLSTLLLLARRLHIVNAVFGVLSVIGFIISYSIVGTPTK